MILASVAELINSAWPAGVMMLGLGSLFALVLLVASEKLKVYTIGVGADEMLVRSMFGTRRINPSADLDEDTLNAIADKTGGRYFRARDTAGLQQIYEILDELEPVAEEQEILRPPQELYYWPLALALLLSLLLGVLSAFAGPPGAGASPAGEAAG